MELQKDGSLIVSDFSKGIGQSVLSEYSDMMGVNIDSNPGLASANFKFNLVSQTMPSLTFTANADTDVLTLSNSARFRGTYQGMAFTVSTTGTLPAGLTANTVYYAAEISSITTKVCTTIKNINDASYVNITGAGTGVHTINWIVPGQITSWTRNSQGRIFALDYNQRVWFGDNDGVSSQWLLLAGNTTFGYGSGIIFYKGYIIVFGNGDCDALLDIQSPYTANPVWTNDFATVTISTNGAAIPYLSINDDSVYFYNGTAVGRYYKVGMFEEVVGKTFTPTDTSTFSFVAEALTIPYEENGVISAINEIGEYIIVGTGSDKIYFWDKKSPSFTSFLRLQESGVQGIQVIGNIAYIFMVNSGTIYQANTVSANVLLKMPDCITNDYYKLSSSSPQYTTTSSTIYNRELLFSISISAAGTYPNERISNYLMSYNIDTKKLTKKNISYYGETTERSSSFYGRIYSVFVDGNNIFLGSSSYSISNDIYTYGIESLLYQPNLNSGSATYYVYDSNEPYIITGLSGIGDIYNKKTFREIHISLSRNLVASQGISVYYRRDDNSSWTLLKTIDYTTYGAIKEIKVPAPLSDIIDLQLKITLDGINLTSPMLKFIRLIP